MRLATLCLLSLTVLPSFAAAQGINLTWDDCTLGVYRHDNKFLCNTDVGGPHKLVVSVDPGGFIDNVNGAQGVIDFVFDAPTVPDWWRLDASGCRAGKLSIDIGIGSASAPFSCPEPWVSGGGGQAGGANYALSSIQGPNRARITWVVAIPGLTSLSSDVAPDWYMVGLNILQGDTGTCSGCNVGACIVANEVRLTRPAQTPGGDVFISGAAHSQHAAWRSAGSLGCPGCPSEAYCPVENITWGTLKGMFR